MSNTNNNHEDKPTLKELLTEHLPNQRGVKWTNTMTLNSISGALGISYETCRRWFTNNRIPAKWVNPLCELEGSTLTHEMLIPYIEFG